MASISIRHNKNGTTAYILRAYAGRDECGRSRYLSKTYTPSPGTGKRKIDRMLQQICTELDLEAQKQNLFDARQRFSDYCRHFLQQRALSCSEYTLHNYRISLKKVCNYIGPVSLEQLRPSHLSRMYASLSSSGSQYGKPYSAATIRHLHTLVRMVLGQTVRERILAVNIADRAHYAPPKAEKKEPVFLELSEARAYIRAALTEEDLRIRLMVLLFLYTGMRREELCGLEWSDIDFGKEEIAVRRASVYISGKGVRTKLPKNDSSIRLLKADPLVFDALRDYREWYARLRIAAGNSWSGGDRLFVRQNGLPILPGIMVTWLKRFAKKHGLRPVTPHKLRHTYATLQIFYGTDLRTVADSMGHSTPATTLTIYSHQVKRSAAKAAAAMSAMLTPKSE